MPEKSEFKFSNKIVIFCLLFGLLLIANSFSAEIESPLLQYKLDRLYFPYGQESLVHAGCDFVLVSDVDTLIKSKIEFSAEGVSYSRIITLDYDLADLGNLTAIIRAVDLDSIYAIKLGAVYFEQSPYSMFFPDIFGFYENESNPDMFHTESGNSISIVRYTSGTEMMLAFESELIDGYFSYNDPGHTGSTVLTELAPAPYFTALIPNISAIHNQRGLLTTSLYYRFNDSKLQSVFDGDNNAEQLCFTPLIDTCPRLYDYDITKGQQLLNVLKPFNHEIGITTPYREFRPTINYFADILWRDRVQTRVHIGGSRKDLYIQPIPILKDSLSYSLDYITEFLSRDTVAGRSVNKTIRLIMNHIDEINNSPDTARRIDYIRKATMLLKEDLGVFPLYRPSLFFVHRNDIGGASFNDDGYMDLRKIKKLTLPESN